MTTFVPNPLFTEEVRRDPKVVAENRLRAAVGAEHARASAPVSSSPDDPHPGRYRDSIRVEETATGARVVSTDPAANLVEWGSINNPPYGPLRKGAELSGAIYVDTGRP